MTRVASGGASSSVRRPCLVSNTLLGATMNSKSVRAALRVAATVALAAFVTTGVGWAAVQEPGAKPKPAPKAAPKPAPKAEAAKPVVTDDGFRTATRLG